MVDVDGERYVLLLVTHNHQVPDGRHDAEVACSDALRRHGVIDGERSATGSSAFRRPSATWRSAVTDGLWPAARAAWTLACPAG